MEIVGIDSVEARENASAGLAEHVGDVEILMAIVVVVSKAGPHSKSIGGESVFAGDVDEAVLSIVSEEMV